VTFASGTPALQPGEVVARVTASGKYTFYDDGATDGTEDAAGVLVAVGKASEYRYYKRRAQSRAEGVASFANEVDDWGGEQWVAELTIGPLQYADADQVDAFLDAMEGAVGTVTFAPSDVCVNPTTGPGSTVWYLGPDSPKAIRRIPGYAPAITLKFLQVI
jgi:hypothetical protein